MRVMTKKKKQFEVSFKSKTEYDAGSDSYLTLPTWEMCREVPSFQRYYYSSHITEYHTISADLQFYDRMTFYAESRIVSMTDGTEYNMLPSDMSNMITRAEISGGEILGWWELTKKCTSYSLVFARMADDSDSSVNEYGLLATDAWKTGRTPTLK